MTAGVEAQAPRLSSLEIAAGMPLGGVKAGDLPRSIGRGPLAALEAAITPALERPPCLIAFSGGRDSSALLAVASRTARRSGLAEPIPATLRFSAAEAEEGHWQEMVLAHLGLSEWYRHEAGEELGLLGPVAREVLDREGLLWPPNTHLLAPLLEAARGGTLISGVGGDELFGGWRFARLGSALRGRARPGRAELRAAGRALAPPPLRRRYLRGRSPRLRWLRAEAQRRFAAATCAAEAAEPVRWRPWVEWLAHHRYPALIRRSGETLARAHGAAVAYPFLDPGFIAEMRCLPAAGRGERTTLMRTLFGGLLPEAVLSRTDKADFTAAVWTEETRALAERCRDGLAPEIAALVDGEALAEQWRSARPDFRSSTLLQAGWLGRAGTAKSEPSGAGSVASLVREGSGHG